MPHPHRIAISYLLLLQRSVIAVQSTPNFNYHKNAKQSIRSSLLHLDLDFIGGLRRKVPLSIRDAKNDVERVHIFHNEEEEEEEDEANIINPKDCPQDRSIHWLQFIGITLLLNLAASLSSIFTSKFKNQCMGPTKKFLSSIGAALLLLIVSVWKVFSKAAILMVDGANYNNSATPPWNNANHNIAFRVGLMACCGFLLPIMISLACRHSTIGRNNTNDTETSNKDEPSTAMDCLSCETCKEWAYQNSIPPDAEEAEEEYARLMLPNYITIRKHEKYSSQIDQRAGLSHGVLAPRVSSNTKIWRIYLFLHGVFIGTAATASCSWDGTFVLISTIALVHGMYLEQLANVTLWSVVNENWLRCMRSRSLFSFGGMAAAALLEGIATHSMSVVVAMLAVTGGVYINISLVMVWTIGSFVSTATPESSFHPRHMADEKYYESGRLDTFAGHYKNRTRRASDSVYRNQTLKYEYCMTCAEDNDMPVQSQIVSSASQAIPMPTHTQKACDDQECNLARRYDSATWDMYDRIVSAREAHARCDICMGSMEEKVVT
eukprot:CAMPEP_0172314852 /NCGR_PEP_ID=MMETSP1058-20130122/23369_1 /TAXON_ID=83371 /ORGANISM="Detonula confervacea, Strain CCMP 353" /LENGTH=547 /DNA_ID=CAMNT_0013028801 /DNA_START=200 /DNA_END=1839 /DNA_ORIENTATION=-